MLDPARPALALAPMDGVTDATMRDFMGRLGAFSYAVSEFVRVSADPLPAKVFRREVPELLNGGLTLTGMPVQVQILGGDPEKMALSARAARTAGATAIDLNFGCPAPTVNRNDGRRLPTPDAVPHSGDRAGGARRPASGGAGLGEAPPGLGLHRRHRRDGGDGGRRAARPGSRSTPGRGFRATSPRCTGPPSGGSKGLWVCPSWRTATSGRWTTSGGAGTRRGAATL